MNTGWALMVTLTITWIVTTKGDCPSTWKQFGDNCYYFATNRLTWLDADAYCKEQGGQLAKDTRDVHSFLSAEVAKLDITGCSPIWTCNPYIGLVYRPGQGYKWADGSAVDESFMPWKPGEPNNGDVEKSGEIELRSSDWTNFQWNDRQFTFSVPESRFICQKPSQPEPGPPTGDCPSDWKLFQNKCYYFGTNRITWQDADAYCKEQGGQLAKDTRDVHSFLSSEVAKLDISGCSPIWTCNPYIGLVYRPGQGYKWADGSAVDESFMPWKPGEPNNGDVEKSGEIELRSSDWTNFQWNDRQFTFSVPESRYICEKDAQPEPPPPPTGECASGWKEFQNKCYLFGTNRITWQDADTYCKEQGGQLAKDTRDVHSFLSAEVAKLDITGCSPIWKCNPYIGLVYRPGQGYKWADGSEVDQSFMPWKPGEPNNGDVEKSGEIELRSSDWTNFQWNDRQFTFSVPESRYICEKDLSIPPAPTEAPPPPPTEAPPPPPTEAPPPPPTEAPPPPPTEAPPPPPAGQTTNIPTLPPCEYPVPLRDVAQGRPTHQSSDKPKKDGGSEKAVDGNKDSDLKKGGSCTWTDKEYQPYWQVDLGQTYDIYEVVVTNRQDCCTHRLKNAQIRVGDSQNFEENPPCGMMIFGKMSRQETIPIRCGCPEPMRGRYVSIQLIDKEQMLHLCEVEVMAG